MPPFSFLEEFSVIREKYKTAFSDLMQAAARTTGTDVRKHVYAKLHFGLEIGSGTLLEYMRL